MNKLMAVGIVALLGLGAYAAEDATAGASDFARVQSALKTKAPGEYAKVEKLAATDLAAAMREFYALARKHRVSLPRPSYPGGDARGRHPAGNGERRWRPQRGDAPGNAGNRGSTLLTRLAADGKIRAEYPAEFSAVDREIAAAEAKMTALAAKAGVDYPPSLEGQLRILRAKAPDKLAAIENKAATTPREAVSDLIRLAAEEKVLLPMAARGERGRRNRQPGEMDEGNPPMRNIRRSPLRQLREKFPEEMKRYEELRRENPSAAADLLRELAKKLESQETKVPEVRK